MSNAMLAQCALESDYVEHAYELRPQTRSVLSRDQRLGLTMGGLALGAMLGFGAAMSVGRSDLILDGAGIGAFVLALPLSALSLRQCLRERAFGCAAVIALHVASLLLWLALSMGAQAAPLGASAPALAALVLFASCWTRSEGGIYRTAFQAFVLGVAASAQFLFLAVGA